MYEIDPWNSTTLSIDLTKLAKWYNKAEAALDVSDDDAVYKALMQVRDELALLINEKLGPDHYNFG
jgi:hypothetical protein